MFININLYFYTNIIILIKFILAYNKFINNY